MVKAATILTSACIIGFLGMPVAAVDTDGNYAVRGLGSVSCPQFVTSVDTADGRIDQYLSWLLGYVTARSRFSDNTYDSLPVVNPNAVGGLVYNICSANPNANIESAADGLIDFMDPLKVGAASDVVRVRAGEQATFIRRETLNLVLERIQALGLAVESEKDEGINLAESLADFQESQGLAVTRIPDAETLIALFLR